MSEQQTLEKAVREAFAEGYSCVDQYPHSLREAWESSRAFAALAESATSPNAGARPTSAKLSNRGEKDDAR
jgi:hypothetical protein